MVSGIGHCAAGRATRPAMGGRDGEKHTALACTRTRGASLAKQTTDQDTANIVWRTHACPGQQRAPGDTLQRESSPYHAGKTDQRPHHGGLRFAP